MQEVVVPLDGSDTKSSSHFVSPPVGVLTIQIIRCRNLIIGDITTSDPFVEIHYLDEIYTTPVIYKTLNPDWEETYFDLIIYQTEQVRLKMVVFDHDFSQEPDYLGSIELTLDHQSIIALQNNRQAESKKLTNGDEGTIDYCLNYQPLSSVNENDSLSSRPADIMFDLPPNAFQSDFLPRFPETTSSKQLSVSIQRGLLGVIVISNIELELCSLSPNNHTSSTSTPSSSSQQSASASSHSFYVSLTYQEMKKATDVEKGSRDENNRQLIKVPFAGVYSFVILQQTSSPNPTSALISEEIRSEAVQDHIVVKVTYKNKFGGKNFNEIYFSIEHLLKQHERNLVKNIQIGNLYSGIFKGKVQFVPT
jgi:hypothetical protein